MPPDVATSPFEEVLRSAVRGEVYSDPATRGLYATDASHYQQQPRVVAVPRDEADVVTALKIAHEHRVPTTARGGGTALSGQSFGPGMVIDCSKFMNQVLEINAEEGWARVQPGVVRDQLNAELKPLGLHFAPDPATSSRATVGGMIGNNSSGTRSMVYGKTIDHTLSCRVALADGTVLECGPMDDEAWQRRAAGGDGVDPREAEVYRGVRDLVNRHQDAITAKFPRVMRRVSGYNLDEFVDGAGYCGPIGPRADAIAPDAHRTWNLSNLIVGSEGTLGVLLEAKLRLTPLPHATAVCVVHFDDDLASLAAVPTINTHNPSAVELLDRSVLREAKVNPATKDMATWIKGDPAAVLLTEFFGDTPEDVATKARTFADAMRNQKVGYAHPLLLEHSQQHDAWETRKLGLGLISNVKGPVKGQAFVEDACVPVEVLPEYIGGLQAKCCELGIGYSMYAHASVGVIHFRPAIDLHRDDHREAMQQIAEYAFTQVQKHGGVFAGEHGDGIVRGGFIPRTFGPELYDAFVRLKTLFDPRHLMNPGKIIDSPSMTDPKLLRYGSQYRVAEVSSQFHYRDQGGFRLAVEQCNGVGACRKLGSGTMCPSYMATRDEKDTTRGRANALRLAMSGQMGGDTADDDSELTVQAMTTALGGDAVHEVLDLCLSCKACKSECPNAVDMAKLKAEATQMRHNQHGIPLGAKLIGRMPDASRFMFGPFAWIGKTLDRLPPYRVLFEKLTGIDRRRPLPAFASLHLHSLLKQRPAQEPAAGAKTVVLFNDTYTNTMEPHLGLAAIDLLEGCGYRVVLANAGCCQRPRLSKGLLKEAKILGQHTLRNLDVYAQQGWPIVCLEPSCASALKDDLPDLIEDEALGRRVAEYVTMIDVFLQAEGVQLRSKYPDVLLHGHCHQKALFGTKAIRQLADAMPNTTCEEVDAGCCGMAGSFGYEHHDLSEQIGEDRLFPAVRDAVAQGKTVVACGISCRHQLHDFLDVEAKHWVETVEPAPESE
ncbi:FAD-binding and (Fe-S)-binding domain-containing protein [Algisphaera agarilytica]|uniref:FAD/FMN-containing dehydrogenase/Fe-S oxidoreductase n=1 Tax=Algisphaera agarilytica TaxID=1385975 RepID=A0A7X0H359_9BACT|nr:FAD-binding and (Fe-S)-binding domain-containing protein [Algisphaera agarilytica]MBB6428329.1 FAD/FMN-containing dehydrogenase/Fe-S oxidoreductase [Algisphaera agarilytica]